MNDSRQIPRPKLTGVDRRIPVPRKRVSGLVALLGLVLSGSLQILHAAHPWDGGGTDNNWSTDANWLSDAAPLNDGTVDVFFAGSTRLNPYADTNWFLRQIVFDSSAGAFTVSGSLLTLNLKGIENRDDDTQTINNNLTLNADQGWVADTGDLVLGGAVSLGSYELTFEGAYDTTASGDISGSGSIVKVDAGTLSLSGANTFSGGLDLTVGTLEIGHDQALGTGTLTISAGTTLLGINGSRTLTNSIASLPANFTIGGAQDLTFSADVTMGANLTLTVDNMGETTFSGSVLGGNTLTKQGTGKLILSGANIINGGSILAGAVNLQHDEAFGISKNYTISSGAALEFEGGIDVDLKPTINGSGISNGGALRNISGDNAFSQVVNLGSAATIGSDSGTLTFNTQIDNKGFDLTITGAGNVTAASNIKSGGGLIKNGSGVLTLAGVTAFTGDLTLNAGTLLLGASDRIANAVDVTFAGGTFNTGGYDETVGTLTLTADSIIDLADGDSVLHFADSSGVSWTGSTMLTITNWSGSWGGGGTDQIYFSSTSDGLTGSQLGQIRFWDPVDSVYRDAGMLATGEMVPTPEPATWAGILGLVGLVTWRERKVLGRFWRRCLSW